MEQAGAGRRRGAGTAVGKDGRLNRARRLLAVLPLLLLACSGDDSSSGDTAPPIDEDTCARLAEAAVAPAQAFLDEFAGMTPAELAAVDPPPDVAALQREVVVRTDDALRSGCDAEAFQARLQEEVSQLSGEGEVGEILAAVLRGEVDPNELGSGTREAQPSEVTVTPGEDVAAVIRRVGSGSTITFEPGTYTVDESLVVDTDLRLVGAGRDETVIESSAAGVALAFVGPGGLELSGVALRHVGEEPATVLLAIEGPVTIRDAELSGGVAEGEGAGSGHGVAFAFENLPDMPERTDAERAGDLVLDDVLVADNAAAGLLATGTAAPVVTGSTFRDNGTCGVCTAGAAGGEIRDSTIEGNEIGVQARDRSPLVVEGTAITTSGSLGVSVDGESTAELRGNTITGSGASAVQLTGASRPVVTGNTLRANPVGVLVTDQSEATIEGNTFEDHDVGLQTGGEAVVTVRDNTVTGTELAAISIGETSSAVVEGTAITEAVGVGVEVTGTATATISGNQVTGAGEAGVSVTEGASADGGGNTIDGRQVGIQIGGTGTVDLRDDVVTGAAVAGLLATDQAGGTLTGTDIGGSATAGVLIGGTSTVTLDGVDLHDGAAGIIVREDATPTVNASTLRANALALQIEERGAPQVTGNTITDSTDAGVVIAGEGGGTDRPEHVDEQRPDRHPGGRDGGTDPQRQHDHRPRRLRRALRRRRDRHGVGQLDLRAPVRRAPQRLHVARAHREHARHPRRRRHRLHRGLGRAGGEQPLPVDGGPRHRDRADRDAHDRAQRVHDRRRPAVAPFVRRPTPTIWVCSFPAADLAVLVPGRREPANPDLTEPGGGGRGRGPRRPACGGAGDRSWAPVARRPAVRRRPSRPLGRRRAGRGRRPT